MDALDRLATPAADLLARVDAILARAGAPADHPVWPLLQRMRALPGEAVAAFAAVSPAALAVTGSVLREVCARYAQAEAAGAVDAGWRGAGAESFAVQWHGLRGHLRGELTDRLRATVSYVDAVEDWTRQARGSLARTLLAVLTSAEAVTVRTAAVPPGPEWSSAPAVPPDVARAAADIAARILGTLAEAYHLGEGLRDEWAGRLDEVAYQLPAAAAPAGPQATTEVSF